MKTTEQVKFLLEQGHKRRELVALGFPKRIITRVYRNMKEERAALGKKTRSVNATAEDRRGNLNKLPVRKSADQKKFESLVQDMESIKELIPELVAIIASMKQTGIEHQECCEYLKDGICSVMSDMDEDYTLPGTGEIIRTEGERKKWYFKPSYYYCALCTLQLEEYIDRVEGGILR